MKGARVLAAIDEAYWAMHPAAYESMRAIVESWAGLSHASPRLSAEERQAAIEARQSEQSVTFSAPSTIAVLNMFGVISPRMGMMDDMSQEGCALDSFSARYNRAMNDASIAGVIVNVDSPGGNVFQVKETGDLIFRVRENKPNIAVSTGMAASAAFWLFTQFKERVVSPSSEVGSVGVLMRHMDMSKAFEEAGFKVTYITAPAGGNKAEGNPYTPLSDETLDHYTSRCEEYYQDFLTDLARGSGVKAKTIDADWGRGRMVGARAAVRLGMADRIGSLQYEIDRLAVALSKKRPATAAESEELYRFAMEAEGRIEAYEAQSVRVEEETAPVQEVKAKETEETIASVGATEEDRTARARARLRLAG